MPLLRTSLLKAEPAGIIRSLDELFALAHAIKRELIARYTELASQLHAQGRDGLSKLFAALACAEDSDDGGVIQWSALRLGKMPEPAFARWDIPTPFDADSIAEIKASRLITPYRILSLVVRNEERVFALWSYVAAYAEGGEIKSTAESMAREALRRTAAFRRQRRQAYHRERKRLRLPEAATAALERVDAAALERRLAQHLAALATRLEGSAAAQARQLSHESLNISRQAMLLTWLAPAPDMNDPLTIAEAVTNLYLEQAEATQDATELDALQELARASIARLAWLRSGPESPVPGG